MPDALHAPTLTDGTVTIRALRLDDAPASQEMATDPQMIEWTTVPVPHTIDMAEGFCTDRAARVWAEGSEWIFALEHAGRFAGNLALRPEGAAELGLAEIAFAAHPASRGSGAMERGLRLLLEWGFAEQHLTTVVWRALIGNWGSRKLAWRLGFTHDGVLRRSHPHRGELVDAWVGTLTAAEPRRPRRRWLETPVLDGEAVRLRPYRADDVRRIAQACADPETQRWLGRLPSPYAEDDARAHVHAALGEQAAGRGATWAVADPDSDVLLGSINLFDFTEGLHCELGWWVHPDARGRGVATAAGRRLTTHAFGDLGLGRVTAVVASGNVASRHVASSVGMRHTGDSRAALRVRDGQVDAALYDVLVEEWRSARSLRR